MIALSLLFPTTNSPRQTSSFKTRGTIRIRRSDENDITLYSAVVSRHHLEIRWNGVGWELVNLGANGTYVGGEPIGTRTVMDGMIFRLASSGPKFQIHLNSEAPESEQ
jgi:pSer/pThr/pTyr-binding forkhead associated (FHA) protein